MTYGEKKKADEARQRLLSMRPLDKYSTALLTLIAIDPKTGEYRQDAHYERAVAELRRRKDA